MSSNSIFQDKDMELKSHLCCWCWSCIWVKDWFSWSSLQHSTCLNRKQSCFPVSSSYSVCANLSLCCLSTGLGLNEAEQDVWAQENAVNSFCCSAVSCLLFGFLWVWTLLLSIFPLNFPFSSQLSKPHQDCWAVGGIEALVNSFYSS